MNAGGHGSDVAATLARVRVLDLATGDDGAVPAPDLELGYRTSAVPPTGVVVWAEFALAPGDPAAGEVALAEIVRWRRENQPGGQNAGSVFVNPIPGELSAGELIDRVGLRGHRLGTASVSDKHANFIQGGDGGTAADVLALIELVRQRVADETGFVLRSEVRLVGFTDAAVDDEATGVAL
jgi:UDP-N-acetylmuramate dehydrogenase